MNKDYQLKSILESITKMNNLDFSQKALVTHECSDLDKIAEGLNVLSLKIEQKLRTKENLRSQLNYTQELTNIGSWVLDRETNKMEWSKEVYTIFGKKPDNKEKSFETFLESIYPCDLPIIKEAFNNSHQSGNTTCELEHRVLLDKTNEIKVVLEKCKNLRNEEGKLVQTLGFIKDITEEKSKREANSAVISELNKYKYAIDKSSIVAITDQKGKIKYANDNFCKISKYTKEELIGQDHRIVNSKFHSKGFFKNLWETIAQGKVWKGEIQNKDKYGQFYWVETSIIPFLNETGNPYQYLSIRTDITARKRAEEALVLNSEKLEQTVLKRTSQLTDVIENLTINKYLLKKSEKFNKSILNSLSSHIAVINKNGEIIAVNEAWEKFAQKNGVSALNQSGVGANYFEACENAVSIGDTSAKIVLQGLKDVLNRKEDLFQIEYPCHTPESESWFLLRAMKFENEEEDEPMVVISHTDITTRKVAEQKIVFHSNLLVAVQQSVIATDITGKVIYWNKAAENIYGWSEAETVGKNISEILLSDQTKEQGMAVMEQLMAGKSWSGELTVRRKNGEHFRIWISHSILTNEEGNYYGIIGVSIDITESVKAKEELEQINERYNLVAKATHDSIWELDIDTHKVTRTGDGFEVLFGYEKELKNLEVLNYEHLVHADDLKGLKISQEQAFINSNENYWEYDYRFLKANGDYAYVHDRGYITRDDNGKAIKMIGATQDITERVKHINAIEEQNRKLKEIAWIQSHIVRAPLSRMMGIVNLLQEEELNSDDFKAWVGHFVDSSQELDSIIRDISRKSDAIDL